MDRFGSCCITNCPAILRIQSAIRPLPFPPPNNTLVLKHHFKHIYNCPLLPPGYFAFPTETILQSTVQLYLTE